MIALGMFSRTSVGLSSEHLFYGVEFVVYCEGAKVIGEAQTLDETFWRRVFEQNGRKVRCKGFGAKSELIKLANVIVSDGVPNILVVLDRDYDYFTGANIRHSQVIYSHGYSWESDVALFFDFAGAIALFANVQNVEELEAELNEFRAMQRVKLKRVVALDLKYFEHHQALFDRSKPTSIIKTQAGTPPYIAVRKLLNNARGMGKFQSVRLSKRNYEEIDGVKDFFGKSIARLFYHWFVYRTRGIVGARKIQYDTFVSILITMLPLDDKADKRNAYYSKVISAV